MARDETAWWFEVAEATFGFLSRDHGFEMSRFEHFKGNALTFRGQDLVVVLEAGSDWNDLGGRIGTRDRTDTWTTEELPDWLESMSHGGGWGYRWSSGPIDRDAMTSTMERWATAIRGYLLRRESPA